MKIRESPGKVLSSEKSSCSPRQSHGKFPPWRGSRGKGPCKETEEKRKQRTPGHSGIPGAREEGSRRTGGLWGQYQWQVREGLTVPTGCANMEVTGDPVNVVSTESRVEGAPLLWAEGRVRGKGTGRLG